MKQLDLFEQLEQDLKDEKLTKSANELLFMLNDGAKTKYDRNYYYFEKDFIVLVATNKNKDIIFNIIDFDGNIPKDMSPCWRNLESIKSDLLL